MLVANGLLVCLAPAGLQADGGLPVFVSILPQRYFVDRIGGELVDVRVMVRPGASPASYEPRPSQMRDLARARIYFAVGVPFEKTWLRRIRAANPQIVLVHTEADVARQPMTTSTGHDHAAPVSASPEQGGLRDPHIWLSPPLVMLQARAILAGLLAADREHAAQYEAGYRQFMLELLELDAELRQGFARIKTGAAFMVFHPSWGYFAHAYGLEQIAVEVEGKAPKPAELKELIEQARRRGLRVIFAQPQFSDRHAALIGRAIGGRVAAADPLAADWAANLRRVAAAIREALP